MRGGGGGSPERDGAVAAVGLGQAYYEVGMGIWQYAGTVLKLHQQQIPSESRICEIGQKLEGSWAICL